MARQKNDELRIKILKAAYARFETLDYNEVYLKDIAKDCGITPSLLHHYFPAKSDLVAHIISDMTIKLHTKLGTKLKTYEETCMHGISVFQELMMLLLIYVMKQNNNQMLKVYSYVLCDIKLMTRALEFSNDNLLPYAEERDTHEKRYDIFLLYGSLAQITELYLTNRLMYSIEDAVRDLFARRHAYWGLNKTQSKEVEAFIDSVLTDEFKEEAYQEYRNSLDRFELINW